MKRRHFLGMSAAAGASLTGITPSWAEGIPSLEDMVMGDPDAPVTLIEYSSFTCPHCKTFHLEVVPKLKAEYIDTGKAKLVYREAYFDGPGLWAALVARCGGEMRYFGIVDMLFQKQRDWIGNGQGATIAANLRTIGLASGLTKEQLDVCLADGDSAQTLMNNYEAAMKEFDVRGTPTIVINGEKAVSPSFKDLSALIDAELAK